LLLSVDASIFARASETRKGRTERTLEPISNSVDLLLSDVGFALEMFIAERRPFALSVAPPCGNLGASGKRGCVECGDFSAVRVEAERAATHGRRLHAEATDADELVTLAVRLARLYAQCTLSRGVFALESSMRSLAFELERAREQSAIDIISPAHASRALAAAAWLLLPSAKRCFESSGSSPCKHVIFNTTHLVILRSVHHHSPSHQ
jgi:hypothetical protein